MAVDFKRVVLLTMFGVSIALMTYVMTEKARVSRLPITQIQSQEIVIIEDRIEAAKHELERINAKTMQ